MEHPSGPALHYLDNAATTFPKPDSVLDHAVAFCKYACVSPGRTTFDLAIEAETMLLEARKKLCKLFGGTDPNRLVFGHNATDALNLVIFGMLRNGGHVVTTRLEHNSVLRPLEHCAQDFGVDVTFLRFDSDGFVAPQDVRKAIRGNTKLVIVNHGSNVLGTVQAVEQIGPICREAGVPFCIDAAQTAGMIPIDMHSMAIDVVAFTGHKSLLGPMGTGGLCVGEGVEIPHTRAGGTGVRSAQRRHLDEYPYRLEYGTPNLMGIAGLSRGVDIVLEQGGVREIHAREMKLATNLWEGLRSTKGVTVYCAKNLERRTPVFAFNIAGMTPSYVGTRLDVDFNVACRTGLHCAPLVHEDIGTAPDGAVRFSVGPMTTAVDVDAAVEAIREIARENWR